MSDPTALVEISAKYQLSSDKYQLSSDKYQLSSDKYQVTSLIPDRLQAKQHIGLSTHPDLAAPNAQQALPSITL